MMYHKLGHQELYFLWCMRPSEPGLNGFRDIRFNGSMFMLIDQR